MALPVDVRAVSDPFAEPDPAPVRKPPPLWRVKRLLTAVAMVLVGLMMVLVPLAIFWWPGLIVAVGLGLLVGGAFFVRIDPSPPHPPK